MRTHLSFCRKRAVSPFLWALFLCLPMLFGMTPLPHQPDPEKEPPVLYQIRFEGNITYPSLVLREQIAAATPSLRERLFRRVGAYTVDPDELQKDAIRLERFYRRRGFPNAVVVADLRVKENGRRASVTFRVEEGLAQRIVRSEIVIHADSATENRIRGDRAFVALVNNHAMAEGKRYQPIFTTDVTGAFRSLLEEMGYPWPEVEVVAEADKEAEAEIDKEADRDGDAELDQEAEGDGEPTEPRAESTPMRFSVTIHLKPGTVSEIHSFEVTGQEHAPESIILRQTGLHKGDRFSASDLREAQRQLYAHPLFRFATITLPDQPRDSTLHLHVRVREYALRTVSASAGVGNEDILRGEVSWVHRNVAGRGYQFRVSTRASFIEQQFSLETLIPYVFNNRSQFVSTPFVERKKEPSYDLFSTGWSNRLIYQIDRRATASLSYEFSINEELSKESTVELPETEIDYNISSFVFSAFYSEGFRRNPSGWVISPTVELSGLFGESTYSFQKVTADVRYFLPVTPFATIAARVYTGIISGSPDTELPSDLLYFAGGTNSVRGWKRQFLGPKQPAFDEQSFFDRYLPVGGKASFTFNVEWRQQLHERFRGLGFALFLDGGQVWPSFARIEERPVQFGAGGGLRYASPIGPVRIDIGYMINPTDEDLNRYQTSAEAALIDRIGIHFSIGQAF